MNNTICTNDPEVIRIALAAFPDYRGRTFEVTQFAGPMRLDSCWSDGSRDYYVLLDLGTLRSIPIPENGTPFSNGGQIMRLGELPVNAAVVQHIIFSGKDLGIRIHVRPENMTKMLPPPVELSLHETIVLVATKCLKSFARFDNANRHTGITKSEFEAAKQSLIAKGLLNSAGAITNDGRNAAHGDLYQFKTMTIDQHGQVLKVEKVGETVELAYMADGRIMRNEGYGWGPWKRLKPETNMADFLANREQQAVAVGN